MLEATTFKETEDHTILEIVPRKKCAYGSHKKNEALALYSNVRPSYGDDGTKICTVDHKRVDGITTPVDINHV